VPHEASRPGSCSGLSHAAARSRTSVAGLRRPRCSAPCP
jgi:hypothetical protein